MYVPNQSFSHPLANITLAVDGHTVVSRSFHVANEHNWTLFDVVAGRGRIEVTESDTGAHTLYDTHGAAVVPLAAARQGLTPGARIAFSVGLPGGSEGIHGRTGPRVRGGDRQAAEGLPRILRRGRAKASVGGWWAEGRRGAGGPLEGGPKMDPTWTSVPSVNWPGADARPGGIRNFRPTPPEPLILPPLERSGVWRLAPSEEMWPSCCASLAARWVYGVARMAPYPLQMGASSGWPGVTLKWLVRSHTLRGSST